MSQNVIEETIEATTEEEITPSYSVYADIHNTGGADSSPDEILANSCDQCFTVLPRSGKCCE